MSDNSDQSRRLPVLYWRPGYVFEEPPGYVPSFVEVGAGITIDEARLRWILAALLAEHPEAERVAELARTRPGLSLDRVRDETGEFMVVLLAGEAVGVFDPRLLEA